MFCLFAVFHPVIQSPFTPFRAGSAKNLLGFFIHKCSQISAQMFTNSVSVFIPWTCGITSHGIYAGVGMPHSTGGFSPKHFFNRKSEIIHKYQHKFAQISLFHFPEVPYVSYVPEVPQGWSSPAYTRVCALSNLMFSCLTLVANGSPQGLTNLITLLSCP